MTLYGCKRTWTFQSTLPYGSDYEVGDYEPIELLFQSTLPYGSDPQLYSIVNTFLNFNPRSLTGATFQNP